MGNVKFCVSVARMIIHNTRKIKFIGHIVFGIHLGDIYIHTEVNTCFQGNLQHLADVVFDGKLFRCDWVCVIVSL